MRHTWPTVMAAASIMLVTAIPAASAASAAPAAASLFAFALGSAGLG